MASFALTTGAHAALKALAVSGDPVPRSEGTLSEIGVPIINASGQVAFGSVVRDNGLLVGNGIFRAELGDPAISTIALSDEPTPEVNGVLQAFTAFGINDDGDVGFLANLTGTLGGFGDHIAIYRGTSSGAFTKIMRAGDTLPGSDAVIGFTVVVGQRILSNAGDVAFSAIVTADGVPSATISQGDGGNLVEIANTLDESSVGLTFNQLTIVGADRDSRVYFYARAFTETFQTVELLLRSEAGVVSEIVRSDDASPDGNGTFFVSGILDGSSVGYNDSGAIAFRSTLNGSTQGGADNNGVFIGDSGGLSIVARKGDLAVDGNGRYLSFDGRLALNDSGRVLFLSQLTGASGGSDSGLFVGDGVSTEVVARSQEPAPGGGVFADFGTYALNDAGQAVFAATVDFQDGGSTVDSSGLFLFDPTDGLRAIALDGQQLGNLGAMSNFQFAGGDAAFNDAGEAVFSCFVGGQAAVVIESPSIVGTSTTTSTTSTTLSAGDDECRVVIDYLDTSALATASLQIQSNVSGTWRTGTPCLARNGTRQSELSETLGRRCVGRGRGGGQLCIDYTPSGQGIQGPTEMMACLFTPTAGVSPMLGDFSVTPVDFAVSAVRCGPPGSTTTTTLGSSSTTTTTTLSGGGTCSQPVSSGASPTATDCLFILQVAVGIGSCSPACVCDPNGSGNTTASDALVCLNAAVGGSQELNCLCDGSATTTTTVPTGFGACCREECTIESIEECSEPDDLFFEGLDCDSRIVQRSCRRR